MILGAFAQFVGGLITVNAGEWIVHKHVLHGLGRRRGSFFAFHWREHHRTVRGCAFRDPDYERSVFGRHAQGKEAGLLVAAGLAMCPLGAVSPWFVGGIWTGLAAYYFVHRKAHLDPEWAKEWVPGHYAHHMLGNQQHSWNVTLPIFDTIMRTRWCDTYSREDHDR